MKNYSNIKSGAGFRKGFTNTIITLAALIILAEGVILISDDNKNFNFLNSQKSLEQYAEETIEKCSSSSSSASCYDIEIPRLMDDISFDDAFKVTKIIQEKESGYWYCHVLGHNLSARETAKDPSNWQNVIASCPSGICSNGCIHGAFQERFRVETLSDEEIKGILPDLKNVCQKREGFSPTGLEQASCYHALGHLTMYMTGANIYKSIDVCDDITTNYKQMCYDGTFMQIYQPLEPEDFALIVGIAPKNREDSLNFCNQFAYDDFTKGTCIRESWPLWRTDLRTAQGLLDFCNMVPDDDGERRKCFNAIFYVNAPQLGFDIERIGNLCSDLPEDVRSQCFANSASRMIETDYRLSQNSVSLCNRAESQGVGDVCWRELSFYAGFNYHQGSAESIALCQSLPPGWRESCLKGNYGQLNY